MGSIVLSVKRAACPSGLSNTCWALCVAFSTTISLVEIAPWVMLDQSGKLLKLPGKVSTFSAVLPRVLMYFHHIRFRSRRLRPPCICAGQ